MSVLSVFFLKLGNNMKILFQVLSSQKLCKWSLQAQVLVTVYWLACEALCKATAEHPSHARSHSWLDCEGNDDHLQGEIKFPRARGDGGQALLALLAVGHCGPRSGATSGFFFRAEQQNNNKRNPMGTIRATAGCLWCQRCIFGCSHSQCSFCAWRACPPQVPVVTSTRWLLSLRSRKRPTPAASCFNHDPTVSM